jgi:hypothetical protein
MPQNKIRYLLWPLPVGVAGPQGPSAITIKGVVAERGRVVDVFLYNFGAVRFAPLTGSAKDMKDSSPLNFLIVKSTVSFSDRCCRGTIVHGFACFAFQT